MSSTKQNIADALKRLLQSKPFTKVTINDIARECGVTRMTFYYHFTDIYDLLIWICDSDVDLALGGGMKGDAWQSGFLAILETVQVNKAMVVNVCRAVDRRRYAGSSKAPCERYRAHGSGGLSAATDVAQQECSAHRMSIVSAEVFP